MIVAPVQPIHPHGKKSVRNGEYLIDFGDDVLFEQFFHCRLHGTRRSQAMPLDERCRSDSFRFALFGDGVEQLFLLFRNVRQNLAENRIVRDDYVVDRGSEGFERTLLAFGSIGERLVERLLNVVSMSLEQVVNPFYIIGGNASVAFLEMADDERNVDFRHDRFQFQHISAVVERTCR